MTYASEQFVVSLSDAKVYLNISDTDYDALIGQFIDAASNIIENEIGYNPVSQERTEYYDGNGQHELILRAAPVSSPIASLQIFIDSDHVFGNDTKVDVSSGVAIRSQEGILWYEDGFDLGVQNIKIIYTAGWSLSTMPYAIRSCAYELVGWLFQKGQNKLWNIQSQTYADGTMSIMTSVMPSNVMHILQKYKRFPS